MLDGSYCINSYGGRRFDPTAPDPEDICPEDIAHALSLLCRANGHLRLFYSVAQHCLACRREAAARGWGPRLQLLCLLHDASEAYIGDLTRPLKRHLPYFAEVEERMQQTIYEALGVAPPEGAERSLVAEVDDDMLLWEFRLLHPTGLGTPRRELSAPFSPREEPREDVERAFLAALRELREAI